MKFGNHDRCQVGRSRSPSATMPKAYIPVGALGDCALPTEQCGMRNAELASRRRRGFIMQSIPFLVLPLGAAVLLTQIIHYLSGFDKK